MAMKKAELELFPEGTSVSSAGTLIVGGCDAVFLAGCYGTPLYILDENHIRRQCRHFCREFSQAYQNTRVAYASKACLNKALARIIDQEDMELDVVSGGELAIALSAGFPAEKIYFHGNNKSQSELEQAFQARVGHIVADNLAELEIINRLAARTGCLPEILLRVTPGVDAHTHHHITTGVSGSKFGLPLEDAARAIKQAAGLANFEIAGLHCHLGSQIHEVEPYLQALGILLEFSHRMNTETGFDLQVLSLGGGFGVNYTPEDKALPAGIYARAIAAALVAGCDRLEMTLPRLIIEPGRAIVAGAGVTLYTVGMQKKIEGFGHYVAVDGGMADNIRPALYDAVYTAVAANKVNHGIENEVIIAGKYCESGDILIKKASLPELEAGDILAIPVTGAYCLPMSSNYNGALKPAVVLVNNGSHRLIRRREEYRDLMYLDVEGGQ